MSKTYYAHDYRNGWYSKDFTAKTLRSAKSKASKLAQSESFRLFEKYGAYSETVAVKHEGKWRNI